MSLLDFADFVDGINGRPYVVVKAQELRVGDVMYATGVESCDGGLDGGGLVIRSAYDPRQGKVEVMALLPNQGSYRSWCISDDDVLVYIKPREPEFNEYGEVGL